MPEENVMKIDIYNEDGSLKSKEAFTEEMAKLYDKINEETTTSTISASPCFMELLAPDGEFDPTNVIDKYQLLERKLYLDTEITEEIGRHFLERIQFWNSEDEFDDKPIEERIPIQIYIDSPGGLITTTFQIIDAIQGSKTPVITVATGTAYSGAFFILTAGHYRQAFPNATFLFHEGSGGALGDAHKVLQQSKFYESLLKQIKNHVIKTTKITNSLYEKHEKDDWYFNAEKALKIGAIDKISNDVNGGIFDEE